MEDSLLRPVGEKNNFLPGAFPYRTTPSSACERSLEEGIGGSSPVYVQPICTTNLKHYLDFLGEVDPSGVLVSVVGTCPKSWSRYRCENGHEVIRPNLNGARKFCPICADRYKKLKVGHAVEVFKRVQDWLGFEIYLIHIVFTFPSEVWLKIVGDPDRAFKCVYEALKYGNDVSGGVASLHLVHSGDPLKGWYPHIHVVVPNIVYTKNGGIGWFRRCRPFFNHERLKARFSEIIEKYFGVKCKPDVYLRYVKFSEVGKVRHILKYMFRLPVEDLAPVLRGGLSEEVKNFALSVLNFPRKRIRWFGFLADGVKCWYFGKFERFKDFVKRVGEECPICGAKLFLAGVYLDRPPP